MHKSLLYVFHITFGQGVPSSCIFVFLKCFFFLKQQFNDDEKKKKTNFILKRTHRKINSHSSSDSESDDDTDTITCTCSSSESSTDLEEYRQYMRCAYQTLHDIVINKEMQNENASPWGFCSVIEIMWKTCGHFANYLIHVHCVPYGAFSK